ncbi:MAG: hypothetical protein IJY92_06160 [Alphaproteobacteria bacterium]|nr:hypothetical protein [Alphaproteobacteria bacterium]
MLTYFFKHLFSFNIASFSGIVAGWALFMTYTGSMPLPPLLFSRELYFMGLLGASIFHFFLWVLLDKASFYNIKNRMKDLLLDYLVLMAVTTCFCSMLFLINTFY